MGRGSNRKSLKMKRRISWRKNKARLKKRIEEGKANAGSKPKTARAEAPAVTRRANEE